MINKNKPYVRKEPQVVDFKHPLIKQDEASFSCILKEDDKSKNSGIEHSDSLDSLLNPFLDTVDEEDIKTWYKPEYFQKSPSFKIGSQEIDYARTILIKKEPVLTGFVRNPLVLSNNRYSLMYQIFQGGLGVVNHTFLDLFGSISKLDNTSYNLLLGLLVSGLGIPGWLLSSMLKNNGRFKILLLILRDFLVSYISPRIWNEPTSVLKQLFLSGFKLVSNSGFSDVTKLFNDQLLSPVSNWRYNIAYVVVPVILIGGVAFFCFVNKPLIYSFISRFLLRRARMAVEEKFNDFTKASQRSFIVFLKDMFKSMPDKIDNN